MQRLKSNDTVVVVAGKDKGRVGRLLKVLPNGRLVIEGLNLVKKHVKPNPQKQIEGGIVQREASIHASNVALLNLTSNKPDRIGFKWVGEGESKRKVRYFKSNQEVLDTDDRD